LAFGKAKIVGLQWRDLDFDRNELTIARYVCYGQVGK
jgi:hypothetical protein